MSEFRILASLCEWYYSQTHIHCFVLSVFYFWFFLYSPCVLPKTPLTRNENVSKISEMTVLSVLLFFLFFSLPVLAKIMRRLHSAITLQVSCKFYFHLSCAHKDTVILQCFCLNKQGNVTHELFVCLFVLLPINMIQLPNIQWHQTQLIPTAQSLDYTSNIMSKRQIKN